jgi:hypothetical protein
MSNYFQHKENIPLGKPGEFSKVTEEYLELKDAIAQQKRIFSIVESSDLINAVGKYTLKQHKIPLILVILLMYMRKPYKFLRGIYLDSKYGKRTQFNGKR